METTNQPAAQPGTGANPVEPSRAAAATITPDPVTAEILRKHEAGAKLTPSEGGKLGVFKRKLKSALGVGAAQPARENPFASSGGSAPMGSVASAQAPTGGLPVVPVDTGIARRTALATLTKISSVEKRWLTREARAVGLAGNDLADIVSAAGFSHDDTQLVADLSPDICRELGIDPSKSPLLVAGAVLAAHTCSLLMAVMELRELREKQEKKTVNVPSTATPSPVTMPDPARPPGAPPVVT